jgi:hypothetical protein
MHSRSITFSPTTTLSCRCGKFVSDAYKPAEVARGDMDVVAEAPPWSVDAWGLGCLMHELFANKALAAPEELREMGCVPKEVTSEYQKLLSQNPARRLNPNKARSDEASLRLVRTVLPYCERPCFLPVSELLQGSGTLT